MNTLEHTAMLEARRMMLAARSPSELENAITAALVARDAELDRMTECQHNATFMKGKAEQERDNLKAEVEKLRSVLDWDNRLKQTKADQEPIKLEMVECEECANLKAQIASLELQLDAEREGITSLRLRLGAQQTETIGMAVDRVVDERDHLTVAIRSSDDVFLVRAEVAALLKEAR